MHLAAISDILDTPNQQLVTGFYFQVRILSYCLVNLVSSHRIKENPGFFQLVFLSVFF